MRDQQTCKPVSTSLSLLSRAIVFFARQRSDPHGTDTKFNPIQAHESRGEQLFSGGYNEAFVMQFWASYNPRH